MQVKSCDILALKIILPHLSVHSFESLGVNTDNIGLNTSHLALIYLKMFSLDTGDQTWCDKSDALSQEGR